MLFATIVAASCGAEPTTQPTATPVPVSTATRVITPAASPARPTQTIVTTAPTTAGARAQVTFEWAPSGLRPADADDVQAINHEVMAHKGILGTSGNETRMLVYYDPTLITVEQIQEIFAQIGHPVVVIK